MKLQKIVRKFHHEIEYTRLVNKVIRLIFFKLKLLFYVISFRVIALGIHTALESVFPSFVAVLEFTYWNRCFHAASVTEIFIFFSVPKRRPLRWIFILGKRKKSQGLQSGERGGWRLTGIFLVAENLWISNGCVTRCIVTIQRPGDFDPNFVLQAFWPSTDDRTGQDPELWRRSFFSWKSSTARFVPIFSRLCAFRKCLKTTWKPGPLKVHSLRVMLVETAPCSGLKQNRTARRVARNVAVTRY